LVALVARTNFALSRFGWLQREMNTARTVPLGGVKVEEVRLKRKLG
jgi:hypothetical protein